MIGSVKKFSVGGMFIGALILASSLSFTGCLTDDKDDEPTPGKVDSVSTKSVTVGAQGNNTIGSFIDLDTYTVLKQDAAEAASASVDLVFAYSGSASASAVYSPHAAKAGIAGGPGLDIAKDLTTANTTVLKVVEAAKFDALVTVAGLDSLYAAGVVEATGRILVANGTAFAAKTTGGKIVAMKITSVTTSATGEAVISGKAKW